MKTWAGIWFYFMAIVLVLWLKFFIFGSIITSVVKPLAGFCGEELMIDPYVVDSVFCAKEGK